METPTTIHQFWFGTSADDATVAAEKSSLWWGKDAMVDALMRERFEAYLIQAATGELADWEQTPRGLLALILLTDQFSRSLYRNSSQAFAFDRLALAWSREAVATGLDARFRPIERVFLYLPLEHAEAPAEQAEAVRLFSLLADGVAPELRPVFKGFLDFARRHQAIIGRFGRFPHRNALLGRESTPEELAFLEEPGSRF